MDYLDDDTASEADISNSVENAKAGKSVSNLDDIELYRTLKQWYMLDDAHCLPWHTQARKDFDFVACDQWEEKAATAMNDANRVPLTFNYTLSFIKAVCGLEINSRHEIMFLPRAVEEGDIVANETLSETSKWMGDECDSEDEESEAFQNTAICGMGWVESRMDYEEDDEGKYIEESVDPLEMRWDKSACKKNLQDARRIWRVKTMTIDDAQALFPDAERSDLHAAWATGLDVGDATQSVEERRLKQSDSVQDDPSAEVNIVQCQWWERQCYYKVAHPDTGEEVELTQAEFTKLNKNLKRRKKPSKFEFAHAKMYRKVYMQAFIGSKILSKGPTLDPKRFSFQCITGQIHKNKRHWFGLIKLMRDPQMNANKWMSQALHILNTTAKGGIIAERGVFKNVREAQKTYASPDAITVVEDGAIQKQKIMQKPGVGLAAPYIQMMDFAIKAIPDVTGINLELLGLRDANQPGILEAQRKQAGMTILATLMDALRRYRKNKGRLRLTVIQKYLPDNRIIRITGPEGMRGIRFIREEHLGEYDVIVSDAPTSPNQKEATWQMLMQMSQLPQFQAVMTPQTIVQILNYCPLPSKLVQIFQKAISAPNPVQQMMQQLGIKGQIAQIEKVGADSAKAQAAAQLDMAKTILTMAQAAVQKQQLQQEQARQFSMGHQMGTMIPGMGPRFGNIALPGPQQPEYAVSPMGGGGGLPFPPNLPSGMPEGPTIDMGAGELPVDLPPTQ